MSHTPCSRAASWSLAATPPITSSSLLGQIDKLLLHLTFVFTLWLHLLVDSRNYKLFYYQNNLSRVIPELRVVHIFFKLRDVV